MSDEERHHGSFAEGEADPEEHPEDEHVGTFAEGEELLGEDNPEKHREGSWGDENE
jgi:hypothetical protein